VSEMLTASIVRAMSVMIKTTCTSETSVSFYQTTRRNIPEDRRLYTHRHENLKSHLIMAPLRLIATFGIRHITNVEIKLHVF
jgi:hypothetical protein